LQYPSSPALSMLGLEATEVPNPNEPQDIGLSLRNATNNFTAIPNTFSFDIAPAYVFPKKKPVFTDYDTHENPPTATGAAADAKTPPSKSITTRAGKRLWRDSKISFAVVTNTTQTMFAFGTNMPLFKGRIDSNYAAAFRLADTLFKKYPYVPSPMIHQLRKDEKKMLAGMASNDPDRETAIRDSFYHIVDSLQTATEAAYLANYHKAIDSIFILAYQNVRLYRVGFNLDFGTGLTISFPALSFSYSQVPKWSAWLAGSYFFNPDLSILGIGRYTILPHDTYADPLDNTKTKTAYDTHVDFGAKIQYYDHSNFSASFEYLRRTTLNNPDIPGTDRYIVNFSYAIAKTHLLTFSIGKDFDNELLKSGNVVGFLNFLFGFGNERKCQTPKPPVPYNY